MDDYLNERMMRKQHWRFFFVATDLFSAIICLIFGKHFLNG